MLARRKISLHLAARGGRVYHQSILMNGLMDLEAAVGLLSALGDSTRMRLLALLAAEELSVAELTQLTGLAQSRISSHLAKLREFGLISDRRQGTSNYCMLNPAMPEGAQKLWARVRDSVRDSLLEADRERLASLLQAREQDAPWLDSVAGEMERHYSPGRTWEATTRGLLGFIELGDVLDLGSGDGVIAELVAPRARTITCLDQSERMVRAAEQRLRRFEHARVRRGDMHDLPFADASFDQVLFFNALTYSRAPERAVREVARVLRPSGKLALLCLHRHDHKEVTDRYQHTVAGFSVPELTSMLEDAGLAVHDCDVVCRERRKPFFEVVFATATPKEKKPAHV